LLLINLELFITNAIRRFLMKMLVIVIALLIRREIKLKKLDNFINHQILF